MSSSETILSNLTASHPAEQQFYGNVGALLSSKLYHQLTVAVLDFTSDKSNLHIINNEFNNFYILYNDILSSAELKIKSKLNPLMLARIAWNTAQTVVPTQPQKAVEILTELIESFSVKASSSSSPPSRSAFASGTSPTPPAPHAKLYAESKLHLLQMDVEKVKLFLKENSVILKELSISTEGEVAAVHSAYYQTAMDLYKRVGPADAFYKQAIQFLHYTPPAEVEDAKSLARDLCIAALVGKGVYNLGTVVYENSELLATLKGETDGFLVELMESAAVGNVGAFEALETHRVYLESNGCDIKAIQEKILLLGLVNLVFEKESGERTMAFSDIAKRLQVDLEQVEWIAMKALSLDLIKGSMDQVEGIIDVTWVMPRVLDQKMMTALAKRFGDWSDKVSETKDFMGERIPAF